MHAGLYALDPLHFKARLFRFGQVAFPGSLGVLGLFPFPFTIDAESLDALPLTFVLCHPRCSRNHSCHRLLWYFTFPFCSSAAAPGSLAIFLDLLC